MNLFYRYIFFVFLSTKVYTIDLALFDPDTMDDSVAFTVIIKNVGQGSCTIIHNHENNHHLVIDAGSLSNKPKNTENSILEEFGFSEICCDIPLSNGSITVIVSHSDKDHLNLFESVFGTNCFLLERIRHVYLGDHFENYFKSVEARDFLKNFLKRIPDIQGKIISLSHDLLGLDVINFFDREELDLDRTIYRCFIARIGCLGFFTERQRHISTNAFEIIGANAGAGTPSEASSDEKDSNINSAVVRLSINGRNILVMGDATGKTTGRILKEIGDSEILTTELLIASHHGAENDKTNHVTWAAVTRPKHVVFSVGFNEGYKHPTLAATANYLITGLEEDEEDHIILIYNPTSTHAASLRGLTFVRSCDIHSNWGVFRTQKPIHSTGSSGELRYTFTEQGKLKDFWEEITTIH